MDEAQPHHYLMEAWAEFNPCTFPLQ